MAYQDYIVSRRSFLKKSGALGLTGLAMGIPGLVTQAKERDVLKVGIIGVGSRGGGIANIIQRLPEIKVVACADVMDSNLQAVVNSVPGQPTAYKDYQDLLDDKTVEAVIIALPEHLHFPVTVEALQAGKHVYLEKTMTHTIQEAEDLVRIANNFPNQVVQIGHQYRYYMLYHRALEVIKDGWIGDVFQYECQYHRNADWRKPVSDPALERQINWRMYKAYSGGLMTELCSHQVDVLNWFNGRPPLSVTAVGGIDRWKDGRETYDNIRAIYEYPNGVKASVSSILSNAYNGYAIRILGTEGTIEILRNRAFVYPENTAKELATVDGVTGATADPSGQGQRTPLEFKSHDDSNRDPTSYALLDFVECVRTGKRPFSNVESGQVAAKSVILANQSAETRRVELWG